MCPFPSKCYHCKNPLYSNGYVGMSDSHSKALCAKPPPTKVPWKIGFTIRERKINIKKRAKAKPKELNESNAL